MGLSNNEINNIKIPNNFDERLKNTINNTYKAKKKGSLQKRKVAMAAGMMFTLASGFLVSNPEYVEATIVKIREIFNKRNYSIVLEDGTLSQNKKFEIIHTGIKFKFNVDTSTAGVIKVITDIDNTGVKAENFKVNGKLYSIDKHLIDSDTFNYDYQKAVLQKIYSGEDISEELEYVKDTENKDNYLEYLQGIKAYYDWSISGSEFKESVNYDTLFMINGEYAEIEHDTLEENIYYIKIPDKFIGNKNLDFKISIKNISLAGNYGVMKEDEKNVDIKLNVDSKKTAIKYIPINYKYSIDGIRETVVNEMIVYPDGKVELLYNDEDDNEKGYKINTFKIENSDGTEITATGKVGKYEEDYSNSGEVVWNKVPWKREYAGKVTGDTVKIIPNIEGTNNENVSEEIENLKNQLGSMIIKVK